ncbi:BlaI/MecI/CopY family transcriptional regulator [Epidermidibacterium keratini]|uniref:BlaI/MecI/CopY family transcriptional regulator n=1 Tax=Epidermidibacterium keratini TaxID=1891644 RepID=UPI001CEF6F6F|nr:BlaI/MecI/CopY family transcriptional regulator [Epidermidibacterium keratini]
MANRRAWGELERDILRRLWAHAAPLSAKEIQQELPGETPAYTTVLTILDRLREKGLVDRLEESPRKVRFAATRSAAEYASDSMHDALDALDDRNAALLKFAGNLADDDVALLQQALAKRAGRTSSRR